MDNLIILTKKSTGAKPDSAKNYDEKMNDL